MSCEARQKRRKEQSYPRDFKQNSRSIFHLHNGKNPAQFEGISRKTDSNWTGFTVVDVNLSRSLNTESLVDIHLSGFDLSLLTLRSGDIALENWFFFVCSLLLYIGLLGIPCAIAVSVGKPENFHACIFMNSLLLLLCTSSIFSLVAVTIDRFWAIIHPLTYPAKATHRNALIIITCSWILGKMTPVNLLKVCWGQSTLEIDLCLPPQTVLTEIMRSGCLPRGKWWGWKHPIELLKRPSLWQRQGWKPLN